MSCPSGKKAYRNRSEALRALLACRFNRHGRLRRKGNRKERGAYLCGICARWHLTHYPGAEIDLKLKDGA